MPPKAIWLNIVKIYSFLIAISSAMATDILDTNNIDKLPLKIIKPQIRLLPETGIKYKVNIKQLKQYLEKVIIADTVLDDKALPEVFDFSDKHLVGSPGVKAFIKDLNKAEYTDYMFVNKKQVLYHPISKEVLGVEYNILGTGRIIDINNPEVMEIISVNGPIEKGLKVIPKVDLNLPASIDSKIVYGNLKGYIVSNTENLWHMGGMDVVIISLGQQDGLKAGDIFNIYHVDAKNILGNIGKENKDIQNKITNISSKKDPMLTKQGDIMVYKVFNKLSLAIITNAEGAIMLGDQVWAEALPENAKNFE